MENLQFFCSESRVEDNQNIYGRFKLFPFIPGQAVTLVNGLRRCLLSEISGIAITAIKIKGVKHEYSTIVGLRESVLDILLNVKQIVLTSEFQFEQPQVAYLRVQGPGIVRANDIKLPMSIQSVKPEQYIATLLYDGVLDIKFMICSGKNSLVQTPRGLRTPKVLKTKSPNQFNDLQSKQNMMMFSMFLNKNINNFTAKPFLSRTQFVTAPLTFLRQKNKRKIKPYADLVFCREKSKEEKEAEAFEKEIPIEKIYPKTYDHIPKKEAEILQTKLENVTNVFFDAVFLPIDAVFAPVLKVNFAIEENDLSNAPKECVILEIWTNGSIHPIQAIVEASKALTNITGLLEGVTNSKPLFINSLKSFNKALTYNKIIEQEELLVKSFKKKRLGQFLAEDYMNLDKSIRLKEALRFGYRLLFADRPKKEIKNDDNDDYDENIFLASEDVLIQSVTLLEATFELPKRVKALKKLTDKNLRNLSKNEVLRLVKNLLIFVRIDSKIKRGWLFCYDPSRKRYTLPIDETVLTKRHVSVLKKKLYQQAYIKKLGEIDINSSFNKKIFTLVQLWDFFCYKTLPTWALESFFKEHFSEMENKLLRSNSNLPENIDLSIDIGNLDLSLRSYTCLKKAKIENVSDLLQKSANDLLNLKDFGKDSLNEVENSLHRLNLKIAS